MVIVETITDACDLVAMHRDHDPDVDLTDIAEDAEELYAWAGCEADPDLTDAEFEAYAEAFAAEFRQAVAA